MSSALSPEAVQDPPRPHSSSSAPPASSETQAADSDNINPHAGDNRPILQSRQPAQAPGSPSQCRSQPASDQGALAGRISEKSLAGEGPCQLDEKPELSVGKDGDTEQNNPSEMVPDATDPGLNADCDQDLGDELPGSRTKKCFNVACNNSKIYKRIKSKIETSKYRSLCKTCHTNYSNNQFCEFCEQIYDNTLVDDEQEWIGCDFCERWNHVKCEIKHRKKDADRIKQEALSYECLTCSVKAKPKKQPDTVPTKRARPKPTEQDPYQYEKPALKKKTVRQIVNEQRDEVYSNTQPVFYNIFNCQRENFNLLEAFLSSINQGHRLPVPDDRIRSDLAVARRNIELREELQEQQDEKKLKRRKK